MSGTVKKACAVAALIAWVLSVVIVWNKTGNGAITVLLIFSFPCGCLGYLAGKRMEDNEDE